jgi:RNA polymerase sigma factor (sigma-70 family)
MNPQEFWAALAELMRETHGLVDLVNQRGHRSDAPDIAQDVLISLWRIGDSGDIPAIDNMRAYASRAIHNRIIDLAERELRQPTVSAEDLGIPKQLAQRAFDLREQSPDALDVAQQEQEMQIYLAALARLPEPEFTVIKLWLQYNSKAEVARRLGVSIDVVRGLSERARRKLREMFESWQPSAPRSDDDEN